MTRAFRRLSRALAPALLLAASSAWCAIPGQINYQGKLLDLSNNPRNGSYNFTFKIYDAPTAGNLLWSETQSGLSVSNGVFSAQLGSVTPIPAGVFGGASAFLEITVGTEVGSPRQALAASPYAFKAASVDSPLPPGDTQYIQAASSLQSGATFYVSSGTVAGPLTVGGAITAGTGANQITTAAGLLDAAKLAGTVPGAQISGTYANAVTLTNPGNAFAGNGAGLAGVTAAHLLPGDTNYIQNGAALQSGATFYVSQGSVAGPFTATGTVTLGGVAGVHDVAVTSNLSVGGNLAANGAGPHSFNGNIQVNGGINDSGGVGRLTLGDPLLVNAPTNGLGVPAGQKGIVISTNVFFNGAANGDNFIAYPFTASGSVNPGDAVVISGANTVGTVAVSASVNAIGFAVTGATAGLTVWVATSGIVTEPVSGGVIAVGNRVCTSSFAAGRVQACTTNGAPIGKALTGTAAAGQTLTVVIFNGN